MACKKEKSSHSDDKPYSCQFCVYETANARYWKQHMNRHFGTGLFSCETCGHSAGSKSDLKKHLRVHTGERFICHECGTAFCVKTNLVIHLRKHTGEQPFKCNICSYKTGRKGNLTSHMRSHSTEKPYGCFCGFKTARQGHLKRHMATHARGDMPLKCRLCPKRFSNGEEKLAHEKIHEIKRGKKYSCTICDFITFSDKVFKRHMTKEHSKNENCCTAAVLENHANETPLSKHIDPSEEELEVVTVKPDLAVILA